MRPLLCAGLVVVGAGAIFGQSPNALKFEIAGVQPSAKQPNTFMRVAPARNGRYEIKNATMLDLIRTAYGFNPDNIIGGPNWLELDRFDVVAKVPQGADAEASKAMLQALLAERFKLVASEETKPLPTWVLGAGKQPHMKEADGSGQSGCKMPESSGAPVEGGLRLFSSGPDGKATQINLGPGGAIQYNCRNMTMAAFAAELRGMLGAQVGPDPVRDETGLKGMWNFELKYSLGLFGLVNQNAEQIRLPDAIDKQLGLKLEQRQMPKAVVVVTSVNRTPTPNPPGLAEALPTPPAPKEFEVADVKLAPPPEPGLPGLIGFQTQPGGRFTCRGCPLRFFIQRAFNTNNNEMLAGIPAGADSVRVEITAKAPTEALTGPGVDPDVMAPMLRSLLADRFKMTYHQEERQVTAYSLTSVKPKMKKADPESRIFCKRGQAPAGSPPGSQAITCQNATMAFLAEQLLQFNPQLNWPVLDATGIEGGWDFMLTFGNLQVGFLNGPGRGGGDGPQAGAALPGASDPGGGYTLFEAIEKQLGLKLKADKRPAQVTVIDHLELKPTEN
jgi:uncharacterized protein (TIGR03435 family)